MVVVSNDSFYYLEENLRNRKTYDLINIQKLKEPYIEGEKKGFNDASEKFVAIYRRQKNRYKKILNFFENNNNDIEYTRTFIEKLIEEKQKELDELKTIVKEKRQLSSNVKNGFIVTKVNNQRKTISYNILTTLFKNKIDNYNKGLVFGCDKANKIYQDNFKNMTYNYENKLEDYMSSSVDLLVIYKEILVDIKEIEEQITVLDISLNLLK